MNPIAAPRAALLALVALGALTGCLGPRPALTLLAGEGVLSLSSDDPSGSFSLRNSGEEGSVLNWTVRSSSPHVIVNPASGSLRAGSLQQGVEVRVEQGQLSRGEVLEARLEVRSNGGNASLAVSFEMLVDGLSACGSALEARAHRSPRPSPESAYVPDELLVQYRLPEFGAQRSNETGVSEVGDHQRELALRSLEADLASQYALRVLKPVSALRPALVRVPPGADPLAFARRLMNDPRVAYAEPNGYLELQALPNDPLLPEQWHLADFGVPEAWAIETGSRGGANRVVVAVIDSGVDTLHEDLRDKVLPGCDFYDGDNDPSPGSASAKAAHGTHVAGIVAASGDNGLGVASVAYGPGVQILPLKVFDDLGVTGTVDDLLEAILWAAGLSDPDSGVGANPNRAHIINMSLGVEPGSLSATTSRAIDEVTERAYRAGTILFAASGNRGYSDRILAPANSPWVYAVGSLDSSYERSSFSNYDTDGASVDFMAPGGSKPESSCYFILSTFPDDSYQCEGGTSMASPFVAGVAALLLSQEPGLNPAQLETRLVASTLFDSAYMSREAYGNGVVCADRALGASTLCGR